jgi:L-threo-3-deoxy-hexylosonate aldolase
VLIWYVCPISQLSQDELSAFKSPSERKELIAFTRDVLDEEGLTSTPIVAGVGGLSTRETIQLSRDAASAGA